jgi:two-component system, OmpR family, response regulator
MAGEQVCVIEDDEATRLTVRELLEEEGYEVIEAENGRAGLALLNAASERLIVVLDHQLPGLDGCDLLALVAQDGALRDRHTYVFMSASPAQAQDDCEEVIDDLDAALLPKPFNIDELVAAVREAARRLERSAG